MKLEKYKLCEIIEFNPKEILKKGTNTKKIPMEYLKPFYKYISKYDLAEYNGGCKFRNGDTMVARITPCLENGKTAFIDCLDEAEIGFGSTEYIVLRSIKNKTLPEFVYYLATTDLFRKKAISLMTGTSGRQRVQTEALKEFEVEIPSVAEQKKIVKILCVLDNKIKLNNEINNNLSELELTLFKEFIEQNKDSSEKIDLKDCVEKIRTGADAIQRAPIVDYDTGIRCIRVGDMTNNRKYYEWGFAEMTDKDFENYKLNLGDIVVTRTAVNGITKIIDDNEKIVCNNGLIRLKVNNKYNPIYIYMCTKTKDFYDYIHRIDSETSVRPNMKVDYFTSYQIDKISLEKQNEFCNKIEPMLKLQKKLEQEIHNLEQLRDTLLPKLMNGEIDLENIEI